MVIGEGEAIVGEEGAVGTPTRTPTIIIVTRQIHPPQMLQRLQIVPINHTKEVRNTLTYLQTLGGPAPSIGRKVEELRIVVILWCANGTKSSLLEIPPERLASLDK